MRAYCVQLDIVWEDKAANYDRAQRLIQECSPAPGSLVVLPEMFPTGFSMDTTKSREQSPSTTEEFLLRLAKTHRIYIMGGLVAAGADGRPRNQAVVFSPKGELLTRYSKIHPFTLGGEAAAYAAGTEILSFKWEKALVTPFICYDLRFPEIFRAAVRRGTQIFAVIANWPIKRDMHWVTLLQARAIENQAYVIGVNRAGTDPKFTYSGKSMIIDPHGHVLVEIGAREGVIEADIDIAALETWRKDFPALSDMHWNEL